MFKNLSLLAASILVTLLGAELALRALDAFAPFPYPPVPRWPELYEAHAEYGYALHPGDTMSYAYPRENPRTLTVRSNSDGFRQAREIGEGEEGVRILVTGDSFTFGQGVEEAERFTDRIDSLRPGFHVDNIGMTGWGPDMMLLALEAVVDRARPDVVVVALFFDDFRRVRARYSGLGFLIPRFSLEGDSLALHPYPRPGLLERLHLYEAGMRALRGRERILAGPSATEWEINVRILDRIRAAASKYGFETVLVYLPGHWTGRVNDGRRRWVREQAERLGFAYVDANDPIQSDSVATFIPGDGHYSPTGHEVLATALLPVIDSLAARIP